MRNSLKTSSGSLYDFDPRAADYESWYQTPTGRAHDFVQKQDVLKFLSKPRGSERLLDVGCGSGHWSRFFSSLGFEVHGVDLSLQMLFEARQNLPDCTFQAADAGALPFQENSFNKISIMAALEFMANPSSALQDIFRCLKDRGALLVGTLNRSSPLNQKRLAERKEPYYSGKLYSPEKLWELLSPWGACRMTASALNKGQGQDSSTIVDCFPFDPGVLKGPFLVAEVQR
jgi:ubiquinone/menaquinone biosynthesis C-methylase UbiE